MQNNKPQETHTIMPKKLAQALMEAGMKHFDGGGPVQQAPASSQTNFSPVTNNQITNPGGVLGGNSSVANQVLNPIGAYGGSLLGMTQDQYQAQTPNISTQNFQPAISLSQNEQQNTYANQNNLANQLMQQSQGGGPGAQVIAAQTGQNIANQGALMASQRGASSNPALIARQAAQAGETAQQQGLNATSNMALQSQGALANVYGQQGSEALQGEGVEQGAEAAQNTAINQGMLGAENINSNVSAQNSKNTNGLIGGLLGGGGSALGSILYKGGEVKKMDDGGPVGEEQSIAQLGGGVNVPPLEDAFKDDDSSGKSSGGGGAGAIAGLAALLAKGGSVPYSTALLKGGSVPGKASVRGDSKKNDTQPTLLSPGEEVLPRSITMAKNAPEKAKEFVAHLQASKKGKGGYGDVVSAKKSLKDRVEHLEKLCGGGYA